MDRQSDILRKLLSQFADKEATSDYEDSQYAVEFLKLKRQSTKYRTEKTYPTKAAEKQENGKKNRYKDILPFDHSRVKLSLNTCKNDTDFINANFIQGVLWSMEYIATQGPLPHTVLDFWRMLWEYNVQVIVMACREFEMGRKKCERYWPETMKDVFVCEPFKIFCESEENKGDYLVRVLRVTFNNSSHTLKQLHYMNWPDHGIPDSIPPILDMLQDMRLFQERGDVPICIHCSAGCGRTGVLCVIDYTWNLLKRQIIPEDFSIFELVQYMRTQRPSIVQTKEQYELVYRTIKFLFEKHLQMMESDSKEVLATPPAILVESDCEITDFSESEEEPAPVAESRLYASFDYRSPEKEVHTEFSNHFASGAVSQPLSPSLQPTNPLGPKRTPADMLIDMKNWAKHKINPRATATQNQLQKTDVGYQNSETPKPPSLQQTDIGYQTSQILEPPALQPANLGYRKSLIMEPAQLEQPTNLEFPKSQIPKPPRLQKTDLGRRKSAEPSPIQEIELGYHKSHIVEPPLLDKTDIRYQTSPILEPSPSHQIDVGHHKPQIHKPHRPQKADLGCQNNQIPDTATTNQIQQTNTLDYNDPFRPTLAQESSLHQLHQAEIKNDSVLLQATLICLTVEDPYFCPDSPISTGFTACTEAVLSNIENPRFTKPILDFETQYNELPIREINIDVTTPISDGDNTPPLPERTPESYIMADELWGGGSQSQLTPGEDPSQILTPTLLQCTVESSLLNVTGDMDDKGEMGIMGIDQPSILPDTVSINEGGSSHSFFPALPQRTPESYEIANEEAPDKSDLGDFDHKKYTGEMSLDESLTLAIPANTVANNEGGSPPSPAPPLPERTPESYIMADEEDLLQNAVQEKPHQTVLRVGKSSEWSGKSSLDVPDITRSWSRSKSLRARLSLHVPSNFQILTPGHTPSQDQSNSAPCQSDTFRQRQRLGTSSEWAGNSQPRAFQEVMNRSKSVKVKTSKQECFSVVSQPDLDGGATAEPVLPKAEDQPVLNSRHPVVEQPEKTPLSKKSRTKSLKLWKGKPKSEKAKEAPGPGPVPPNRGSTSGFTLSFGTRFGKPKGPRNQPETWV